MAALTQKLFELLTNPERLNSYKAKAELHLSRHQKEEVAKAYLQVFEEAMR